MEVEVLINQLDEHNEGSILATKKFNPKEVIFLYKREQGELSEEIKAYYEKFIPLVKFNKIAIDEGQVERLEEIIRKNKNRNVLVNLTGGSRINSLSLLNICKSNSIKSVYLDVKNKLLYSIEENIKIEKEEYEDLNLNNFVYASGGEIIDDSTDISNNEDLKYITKKIYENLDLWHKYKQKLYDSNLFHHNEIDNKKIKISSNLLDNDERVLLEKILFKLKKMKLIEFKKIKENEIEVIFYNEYIKPFIFKSGTWLEVATKMMIGEIDEVDEVRSGVMFLWDKNKKNIKNEVDVVFVKDSVVTCISCKDSDKYNEDALNELDVYSKQIGGENVNKILVATKEPIKNTVRQRAEEMNINLIVFDGNEEKFKSKIRKVIFKK